MRAGAAPADGAQQGRRRVLQRRRRDARQSRPPSRSAWISSKPTARWRRPSCSNSSRRRSAISGPTETENLAALAQRGFRFSIDHVTDLRIEPRELADRGVRFIKVPAALLLDPQQSRRLRHPSVRPLGPARPLRHRPDRRADRGRARGGRPARLRCPVRPGIPVRAAPAVAARGRICYRRDRCRTKAQESNGSGKTVSRR